MKPRWLEEAEKDIGLREIKGMKHSTRILAMFRAIGHGWVTNDETPWCAAAVGAWLERSAVRSTRKLNARSYLTWGRPLEKPCVGAVVVLWRISPNSPYGHVGFVAGQDKAGNIAVLGGNQGDKVSYATFSKNRVLGYRFPIMSDAPENYRLPIFTDVQLSTSEA